MRPHLVIVGNPQCRRVAFWKAAADRLHWPSPTVVYYLDLLQGHANLADYLVPGSVVRFETAADHWPTFKLLLQHGITPALEEGYPALEADEIEPLHYERGWLIRPRQVFLGFRRLLQELGQQVALGNAKSMHAVDDIVLCFDKPRCQERLARGSVSIPASYGALQDYSELRRLFGSEDRFMVKLAHGSGAAGCLALHVSQGRVRALTTVEEAVVQGQSRLYHSKKVRHLLDESEIADLVNRLCLEKVQVEKWLPKARWQGCNFDLRIVTIAGKARHSLLRMSHSLFTNLTLGNTRGETRAMAERMGREPWDRLLETCAGVARLFPRSFTLGIDVLVRPDFRRHEVLEVNAFGDLLLHQIDQGHDTYTATLAAWESRTRSTLVMA